MPILDAAVSRPLIDSEAGLTSSQAQDTHVVARNVEAGEGVDQGISL